MSTMQCKEFLSQLDAWIEGNRYPGGEVHLHECAACQNLVSDLEAIRSAARTWEVVEPVVPPARIWASLRVQLEADGLIHDSDDCGRDSRAAAEIVAAEMPLQASVL